MYGDPRHYLMHIPELFRALSTSSFEAGAAERTVDGLGVALWLPPGIHGDDEPLEAVIAASMVREKQAEVAAVFEQTEHYRPTEPHWYLSLIVVEALHRNKGCMALRSWARFEWVRRLPYFRCCAPHTEASAHPHGWQFAVDGTILETSGEPAHSTLEDRLYYEAHPTQEYGRIVFAYTGPPDRQPPFPVYDSFVRRGYRLMPGQKYFYPCNWLQIMENAMDPAHTAFLHTIISGAVFTDEFGVLPQLEYGARRGSPHLRFGPHQTIWKRKMRR
jgi:hypothetical protein